jgi:hypothetical protein
MYQINSYIRTYAKILCLYTQIRKNPQDIGWTFNKLKEKKRIFVYSKNKLPPPNRYNLVKLMAGINEWWGNVKTMKVCESQRVDLPK